MALQLLRVALDERKLTIKSNIAVVLAAAIGLAAIAPITANAGYKSSGPGCTGYESNWIPTPGYSRAVTDATCLNHTHADSNSIIITTGVVYYTAETIYGTYGSSTHHNGNSNYGDLVYY